MKIITTLLLLMIGASAHGAAPTLADVRQAIEKKDMETAVSQLSQMHPKALGKDADIARVAKWLSVFLYDETVASYEKAIELASKDDSAAEDQLQKALLKEPHNKILRQAQISYYIDHDKAEEALKLIADAEKTYPYLKVFPMYRRYLQPSNKKIALKDSKACLSVQFNNEETDFCRAVLFREAALQKIKGDKKWIEEGKAIRYPDALYSLWEMTSSTEYLKQYITKCQGLTDQEKRSARLFPGVCSKVKEVEPLLKTEDPED